MDIADLESAISVHRKYVTMDIANLGQLYPESNSKLESGILMREDTYAAKTEGLKADCPVLRAVDAALMPTPRV